MDHDQSPPIEPAAPGDQGGGGDGTLPRYGRRAVLRTLTLGGATVAVVGTSGLMWRASDQGVFDTGQGPAYRAWSDWSEAEGAMAAVAVAVLSASAHNTQPWAFTVTDDRIDVHSVPGRTIGTIDPFLRERDTSLGCALENLILGARAQGITPELRLLPGGSDDSLVASLLLRPGRVVADDLYRAIPERHSNRARFRSAPLPAGSTGDLDALVTPDVAPAELVWLTEPSDRTRFADLVVEAVRGLTRDEQQSMDSHRWYRADWDDIQRHKDGLTFDAQGAGDLLRAVVKILPATSRRANDKVFLTNTGKQVASAAAFGLITVPDAKDRSARLAGGRLVQRLHLAATARGLAFHHLNAVTERIDRAEQLAARDVFTPQVASLLAASDRQLLVAFRIGLPTAAGRRSPRRPLREVVS